MTGAPSLPRRLNGTRRPVSAAASLILLAMFPSLGCGETEKPAQPRKAEPSAACPSEAVVEELHAAAFYFENGDYAAGRTRLANASTAAPTRPDERTAALIARLSEVEKRGEADASWARTETEEVRAILGGWACVTQTAHDGFHERLPPISR